MRKFSGADKEDSNTFTKKRPFVPTPPLDYSESRLARAEQLQSAAPSGRHSSITSRSTEYQSTRHYENTDETYSNNTDSFRRENSFRNQYFQILKDYDNLKAHLHRISTEKNELKAKSEIAINKLNEELKEFKESHKALSEDKAELMALTKELIKERDLLKSQAEEETRMVNETIQLMNKKLAILEQQSGKNNSNSAMNDFLSDLRDELTNLQNFYNEKIENFQNTCDDLVTRFSRCNQDLLSLRTENETIQNENSSLKMENLNLKSSLHSLNGLFKQAVLDAQELKKETEAMSKSYEDQISVLAGKPSSSESAVQVDTISIGSMSGSKAFEATLKIELEKAKNTIKELESRQCRHENEFELYFVNQDLENQLCTANKKISQLENEVEALNQKNNSSNNAVVSTAPTPVATAEISFKNDPDRKNLISALNTLEAQLKVANTKISQMDKSFVEALKEKEKEIDRKHKASFEAKYTQKVQRLNEYNARWVLAVKNSYDNQFQKNQVALSKELGKQLAAWMEKLEQEWTVKVKAELQRIQILKDEVSRLPDTEASLNQLKTLYVDTQKKLISINLPAELEADRLRTLVRSQNEMQASMSSYLSNLEDQNHSLKMEVLRMREQTLKLDNEQGLPITEFSNNKLNLSNGPAEVGNIPGARSKNYNSIPLQLLPEVRSEHVQPPNNETESLKSSNYELMRNLEELKSNYSKLKDEMFELSSLNESLLMENTVLKKSESK